MQDLRRIIWLASYPKSGNTWLRALLGNYMIPGKDAPDINTLDRFSSSDVRQDFFDRAAGRPFRAETADDWVRMRAKVLPMIAASKPGHHFVKTHSKIDMVGPYHLIMPEVTAAGIYIMRNPFDVALSYARHMMCSIEESIDALVDPTNMGTRESGVSEVLGRWDDHVVSWVDARGLPLQVMRYEDMLDDIEREIRKLMGFLRLPVKDGQLRRAIRATSFDKLKKQEQQKGFKERPEGMEAFFAKGTAGGWREDLAPDQIARIRSEFAPALERFYPELHAETAEFTS